MEINHNSEGGIKPQTLANKSLNFIQDYGTIIETLTLGNVKLAVEIFFLTQNLHGNKDFSNKELK